MMNTQRKASTPEVAASVTSSMVVTAVAGLLRENEAELVEAGGRGLSLAEIAESRGVDIEGLVTALLRTPREATERAVVAGTLGRSQADAIIEHVANKLCERVTDPPDGPFPHIRPLGVPPGTGRRFESAGPHAGDDLPPAA